MLLCAGAWAQVREPPGPVIQPPAAPGEPPAAAASAPERAMAAYRWIDESLRAWADPDGDPPEVGAISGAAVAFRLGDSALWRGTAMGGGADSITRAFEHARARARLPVPRDALYEQGVHEAAARIRLSLELAGPLEEVWPESFKELALSGQPGLDGVAVGLAERTEAVFPEAMLSLGMDSAAAARSLVSRLTDDPASALGTLAQIRDRLGVRFYRFRTIHLAQATPGDPPIFLHRGSQVVPIGAISTPMLRQLASGIVEHLDRRRWPGPEPLGLMGTLDAATGRFDPPIAPPFEQALTSFALERASRCASLDQDVRRRALNAAREILRDLGDVSGDEREPWGDPVVAALCWIALQEMGIDAQSPAAGMLKDRCAHRLAQPDAGAVPIASGRRALVAWALLRLGQRERAEAMILDIHLGSDAGRLVAQMPWLGWADMDRTRAGRPIAGAAALEQMRQDLWAHQITAADVGTDGRDLIGGIVFTAGPRPLPDWRAARPLCFVATMLGEPSLTDPGRSSRPITDLMRSIRFLRQLAGDEASGSLFADPRRARWGIRDAPWSAKMSPHASAMTLLTLTEALNSLDRITAQTARGRAPGGPKNK